MGIEMCSFSIRKDEDLVKGMFKLLNYENTLVTYELKAGSVLFEFPYWFKERTKKRYMPFYKKWYGKEKELYEKFILNYVNELEKIDTIQTFKGEIKDESIFKGNKSDPKLYDVKVEFEHSLKEVLFSFIPMENHYTIEAKLNIPINSEKELINNSILLKSFVKEETIKQMWEPFRTKTKYKLPLLHVLR